MMQCTVLFFAGLVDATGERKTSITLHDGATLGDALSALAERFSAIASQRDVLAAAVNERYCPMDTVLNDGDVIAIIPPVSGG